VVVMVGSKGVARPLLRADCVGEAAPVSVLGALLNIWGKVQIASHKGMLPWS